MSRTDRTLAQMEEQPEGWRYEQVASVLRAFGFGEKKGATSHRQWTHPKSHPVTVVANGKKVPGYQVKQATAAIRGTLEPPTE
jgi:predicted RNA binding protein YcfA (HicA-like mRNA interferase family)